MSSILGEAPSHLLVFEQVFSQVLLLAGYFEKLGSAGRRDQPQLRVLGGS